MVHAGEIGQRILFRDLDDDILRIQAKTLQELQCETGSMLWLHQAVWRCIQEQLAGKAALLKSLYSCLAAKQIELCEMLFSTCQVEQHDRTVQRAVGGAANQ